MEKDKKTTKKIPLIAKVSGHPSRTTQNQVVKHTKETTENFSLQRNISDILIVAGEPSGDLLGAGLIHEFKKSGVNFNFFGIGGDSMMKAGFETIEDIENMTVIGFSAVLMKYRFLKKVFNRVLDKTIMMNCKLAILIDYPGFNLRLAPKLKELNIPVVYYVSPQIWAWKFNRIYSIKENTDLMITLFRFEKKIFDEYGVRAEWGGHTIAQRIREKLQEEDKIQVEDKNILICLMPGSRSSEIKRLLDPMLASAASIHSRMAIGKKKIEFIIPGISKADEGYIQEKITRFKIENPEVSIRYHFGNSLRAIQASEMVIVASGTATLEVAFFEKPMVIVYKLSWLSFFIGAKLTRSMYFGLVNILAGKEICRELLQSECKSTHITEEAMLILENSAYRERMIQELKKVKQELNVENAAKNAVDIILKMFFGKKY